jgi:hypothetical protein
MLAFGGLGVAQVAQLPEQLPNIAQVVSTPFDLPEFGAAALPDDLVGFRRVDYQYQRRVHGDPMGEFSQIWIYEQDGIQAHISVDYPYPEVHDLCICYENTGWKIQHSGLLDSQETIAPSGAPTDTFDEANMYKSLYGNGYLLFSLCNAQGETGVRLRRREELSPSSRLMRRLGSIIGQTPDGGHTDHSSAGAKPLKGPLFQTQLVVRSHRQLSEEQRRSLGQLFVTARAQLSELCLNPPQEVSR